MTEPPEVARMQTGVRNLDDLLNGGLPEGSVTIVAGPPGAGKTILTQQICFHNASPERPVLYFNTLSEPTAKTLRYLSQFEFFDAKKVDDSVQFVDLGDLLRTKGLEESFNAILQRIKTVRPGVVVIDSFKVFDDLAKSRVELRRFSYDLAVHLMAWEITTFLLGEFNPRDIDTNPLFSIVDGLIEVHQREQSGEQQRFLQIVKMRGTSHSRDPHSFVIMQSGVEVYAPRVMIKRESRRGKTERMKTGIGKLDALLDGGIPLGSSVLISGVAGTGKTLLSFEFLYRGAEAGEKGIMFSFEETRERLLATARGLGWDLEGHIESGMLDIVFIPQPDIMVEAHLPMMQEKIEATQARRVVVDSVSVFLHKVEDPQIAREKIFQIASIVQNAGAVAFLNTDIPYGSNQISRFGVEETVVEGVILLTSTQEGLERQRYLEIYKLRNTAHLKGRHSITIGPGGVTIYPRYESEADLAEPPLPVELGRRLPSGIPALDELLCGGLLERSVTLLSGSAGIGKSTMAIQFVVEGARHGEPGLFVALEEGPAQIVRTADALGIPLKKAVDEGLVEIMYLARERIRPSQLLSLLADRVSALKARRFVLDSVSHLAHEGLSDEELRQLLYALSVRFKSLGATTLFTLESTSMYSSERITERRFSPLADNLIALRYARLPGEIRPLLTIAKTRGSKHDFALYYFSVGKGGVRIEERADGSEPEPKTRNRTARRRTKPGSP